MPIGSPLSLSLPHIVVQYEYSTYEIIHPRFTPSYKNPQTQTQTQIQAILLHP